MNVETLNKDQRIKSTVRYLADKYGSNNFKIKDHWDADLSAIGLTDNEEKYLVYIRIYNDNCFYVALENLKTIGELPYEPVGDFNDLDLKELEKIFTQHLRL